MSDGSQEGGGRPFGWEARAVEVREWFPYCDSNNDDSNQKKAVGDARNEEG